MSNRFSPFLKKKILRKNQNLVSLDEPYEVIRRLLKGREIHNILDAGASNGHISGRFLKKFPKATVYAFEPNTMYSEQLANYAAREKRFRPFYMALSDHCGTAELNVTESAGCTSLCAPVELVGVNPTGAAVKSRKQVQIVTIDQWARDNNVGSIEVMKFDIQAYELAALKGAVTTLRDSTLVVYTEIWFNPVYEDGALFGDIDSFLRKNGFVLYDIFKPKYDAKSSITVADALYIKPDVLVLR